MTPGSVLRCALPNKHHFRKVTRWMSKNVWKVISVLKMSIAEEFMISLVDLFRVPGGSSPLCLIKMRTASVKAHFLFFDFSLMEGTPRSGLSFYPVAGKMKHPCSQGDCFLLLAHWLSSLWIHTFFLNWLPRHSSPLSSFCKFRVWHILSWINLCTSTNQSLNISEIFTMLNAPHSQKGNWLTIKWQ